MIGPYLYYIFIIFELLVAVSLAVYSVSLLFSFVKGAPYVSTKDTAYRQILAEADLQPEQLFIELGSGDGRLVRHAVLNYRVKGIGVEINPTLTYLARRRAKKQRLRNITFLTQNIKDTDLRSADVIYMFLLPQLIDQLKDKLTNEPKNNTLIISHAFKIHYLERFQFKKIDGKFQTYFYRILKQN